MPNVAQSFVVQLKLTSFEVLHKVLVLRQTSRNPRTARNIYHV